MHESDTIPVKYTSSTLVIYTQALEMHSLARSCGEIHNLLLVLWRHIYLPTLKVCIIWNPRYLFLSYKCESLQLPNFQKSRYTQVVSIHTMNKSVYVYNYMQGHLGQCKLLCWGCCSHSPFNIVWGDWQFWSSRTLSWCWPQPPSLDTFFSVIKFLN